MLRILESLGFSKKCEHKNRRSLELTIVEELSIIGDKNGTAESHKEVYYCKDCRVLFLPKDKEKIKNFKIKEI
jgi:hypothetical protein